MAVLWELKSQCHVQLEEWLEAMQAAERAVELSGAQWPDVRHTLGQSCCSSVRCTRPCGCGRSCKAHTRPTRRCEAT